MFNQILVPTDGSPSALLAVRLAGLLCTKKGSVRLLHVTPGLRDLLATTVDSATAAFSGLMGDLRDQLELAETTEATTILTSAQAALPTQLQVETFNRRGPPVATILEELQSSPSDSVVLGSRGRGAIARAFFGSVVDGVVRRALKPVMIARRLSIGSILVGIDGSDSSRNAVRAAGDIALQTGASLTLLHVADIPTGRNERTRVEELVTHLLKPEMAAARADIAATVPGLKVHDRIVFDEPAHGLLDEAAHVGADLIVLGRRGRAQRSQTVIGSVALRVVTHSEANVLVVP